MQGAEQRQGSAPLRLVDRHSFPLSFLSKANTSTVLCSEPPARSSCLLTPLQPPGPVPPLINVYTAMSPLDYAPILQIG